MTMSLENRIRKGLEFDDDTYYSLSHVYTSLVAQVHSVVVTQKGFQYLRVWRARCFGPAKFSEEREERIFRITQEIFKSYLVPPDPRIGKAIEYFGKEYLLEIAVYDNHQEVIKTVNSGDFILLSNVHIGSKEKAITLSIHGGGFASYNREITPIPTDFSDPKMRLFRKRCRRMLEQVTNYENFEEFIEHEELDDENDNLVSEPYKNIMIGDEIAVNYFPKSSQCSYYFLTHIHPEYLRDLDLTADRTVFCSETTSDILPEIMGIDSKNVPANSIFPMRLNHPYSFEEFQATMIDSNHCPGSVMILFEGELIQKHAGGPVLCTGDFRADKTFLSELKSGPSRFLSELKLARIHMDNTYFSLDQNILQLDHARDLLIQNIESRHPDKNIIIPLHRLGRESLIESIVQALNEPILMFKARLEIARILNAEHSAVRKNTIRNIEIVEKDTWDYSVPENSVVINISMNDCIVESQQEQLNIHEFVTTDDQGTSESLEVVAANPDFQETSKSLEVAEIEMKGSLATKPPNLLEETSDTGFCEESGSVQMEPPRKKGKFQNLQEKIMHI
ncbi:hypothetical protein GCK72_000039 [Caenorhabditis remanei]|uniref:Protection of telomeres protein 1 ssDNA-binding domain-containing protein n=1 Tax=Caenorhabditis remanei TaxID=31234 RepID=A0A6A5HPJ4_CAERE|nr:hypothetical protein GCK72_000039 [Caenorhabditis remanei]KAF1768227.1 hypothetical protein GCK72_000039 [Caenorhabditis remanei]